MLSFCVVKTLVDGKENFRIELFIKGDCLSYVNRSWKVCCKVQNNHGAYDSF